eukprot:TRINITY_DN5439_c0_g1_i1.p1 TRINITY_DN5439_c0_g1~~TRINITY_DN5439_c0_g1_i1.p1  ORF type:complete len:209 (-),score=27.82 TRINITY_DN5439_c0_g1_i1:196-822(-)
MSSKTISLDSQEDFSVTRVHELSSDGRMTSKFIVVKGKEAKFGKITKELDRVSAKPAGKNIFLKSNSQKQVAFRLYCYDNNYFGAEFIGAPKVLKNMGDDVQIRGMSIKDFKIDGVEEPEDIFWGKFGFSMTLYNQIVVSAGMEGNTVRCVVPGCKYEADCSKIKDKQKLLFWHTMDHFGVMDVCLGCGKYIKSSRSHKQFCKSISAE